MAAILGGGRVNDQSPPATSLRIQSSLNGQPIAIVHGRNRVAGNLIWYGGFAYTGTGKGGKGGLVGGGKGQQQANYSADVIIGLAEGPLCYFGTVWSGQTIQTAAQQTDPGYQGASFFTGAQGQAPWGWLETAFPPYALGYSSLGYVGYDPIQLGSSPVLPNLTYELGGSVGPAVQEALTIPATGSPVLTPAWWNLSASVTEQVTIPATAPYQYTALNPFAANTPFVQANGSIYGLNIPGTSSQGVVDIDGRVFTRVTGTPSSGEYTLAVPFNDAAVYTFAAADAGLDIAIIDLAVSPGVTLASTGEQFSQVLGSSPSEGQFSVSVQPGSYGQYLFNAADAGKQIVIVDIPDADPAASLTDYLTNPRYGCGLPSANIGDLTPLQSYAFANGLFISPAVVASQAASSYLEDFATGLNGEFVWSSGQLSFVPYGDVLVTGYGKTYSPPSAVTLYGPLTDDDFLKNEGTASVGVSAFTSDDPVICVRTRPSDAYNDVKVEYLDRGNSYNPAIAEAQDDAAIDLYGLRPADTKQLHFFCYESAGMLSAQLQLSRQQVRNLYTITVPWYFILLDPMDIVAISDPALGLDATWVRILEITENQQDMTLTMTFEEYLQGTGSVTTDFANQARAGYAANLNAPAPSVNAPIIFEPPQALLAAQVMGAVGSPSDGSGLGANGAPQVWIAVSPEDGARANYGGAQVWLSFDGTSYGQIGFAATANQGVLTAALPAYSGTNPDTTDTLAVDLSMSGGTLPTATDAAAAASRTLALVDGDEYLAFGDTTPTTGDAFDLTDLYRGLFGTDPDTSHASGASFLLIDDNIFKYNLPPNYVGETLYFKFVPVNAVGAGVGSLADATSYPFAPTGVTGSGVSAITATTGTSFTGTEVAGNGTLNGWIVRTGPTADFTDTLPTASQILAALPSPYVNQQFDLTVVNETAFNESIAPASGVTFAGNTSGGDFVLAMNTSRPLLGTVTALIPAAVTITG